MSELFAYSHPAFIWPSWGLAVLGVGGLIAWVLAERRAVKARLEREEGKAKP